MTKATKSNRYATTVTGSHTANENPVLRISTTLTAREVFERLKEFLDTLGIAVEAERIDDNSSMEYMP